MKIEQGNAFQANSTHFRKYYHRYGKLCFGEIVDSKTNESFIHCWIEILARHTPYYPELRNDKVVIDVSNGRRLVYPVDVFYRLANVNRKSIQRFSATKYGILSSTYKSFGPFTEEDYENIR